MQVVQIGTLHGTKNLTIEYCEKISIVSNKTADSTVTPVCTLLFSQDRRLSENIKTSVDEEFNILQTDVFILCKIRPSEENKRVQTG